MRPTAADVRASIDRLIGAAQRDVEADALRSSSENTGGALIKRCFTEALRGDVRQGDANWARRIYSAAAAMFTVHSREAS